MRNRKPQLATWSRNPAPSADNRPVQAMKGLECTNVAAEELRAARAYVESIVDTVHEGLVVLDADLRVVSANRSFCEMFHVSKADAEGQLLYELCNRQWDIPALHALLERILPERLEITNFEVEHDFATLGHRTMLFNGRFLTPGTGRRVFVLAINDGNWGNDPQMRLAVQASGVAIHRWDVPRDFIYCGPALREMYGFSADEVVSLATWLARVHPDDRQRIQDHVRRVLATPGDDEWREEFCILHPQLGMRWIRQMGRCFRDAAGQALYATGVDVDVTEQKDRELEIARLNATLEQRVQEQTREIRLFATAVSHLTEGVVIASAHEEWLESRIVFANDAMCGMAGYAREELVGQSMRFLHGAASTSAEIREPNSLLSNYRAGAIELVSYRKDGTLYDVELVVTQLWDATGQRTHFVSIYRDISARKIAEQQLRQREAEVMHSQRLHAVGEMVAGLAHDLAQPLSVVTNEIGACIRFVQAKRIAPRIVLEALEHAAAEAEHAGHLVQRLRQIVEKRPTDVHRIDLRTVVSDSIALVRGELERRQIRLQVEVEQHPLLVNASVIEITQVLVNLLQNAIDAIDTARSGRREIIVRCKQSVPGTVEVSVDDSGIGLGQTDGTTLFEPFFTTKPHGLGMGLAISRRIVEAHEGRIWAEPAGDTGGATFRFTLRLSSDTPDQHGTAYDGGNDHGKEDDHAIPVTGDQPGNSHGSGADGLRRG